MDKFIWLSVIVTKKQNRKEMLPETIIESECPIIYLHIGIYMYNIE